MKIELKSPYREDWDNGYLLTNREGRKIVCLYRYTKDKGEERSTTAYAKYIMCVHLGRYLEKGEEVDHINEDKTDDRIENLQLLSSTENKKKYSKTIPAHVPKHGTLTEYKSYHCRCELCVQYNRAHQREYMAKRRAAKRKSQPS